MKFISLDNLKYLMRYLKSNFIAPRAKGDELGRDISETYITAAGGNIDGVLHINEPEADDCSDQPATTNWTKNLLKHTLPSKKEDGSLQSWDINVTGNAATATAATNAKKAEEADHAAEAEHAKDADHVKDSDHATEADHAKKADAASTADSVAWNNVVGKPDTTPLADGLRIVKTLGSDDAPYTMKDSDFDQCGMYVIVKGDAAAEPFADNLGDTRILNMYPLPRFHTLIAVSPRSEGGLAVGRFWDGIWKGWHRLLDAQPTDGATLIEPKALGEGFEGVRIAKASNNWAHLTLGCTPGTKGGLPNKTGGWFIGADPLGNLVVSNESCTTDSSPIFIDKTKRTFTQNLHVREGNVLDCAGAYSIRTRDPRVVQGQLIPQGQQTCFNAIMYEDKNWQPFVWAQSFIDSWNMGYDVSVAADKDFKKSVHFNLFLSPTTGDRYMTTNATFQPEAITIPTSDNGHGNFWIS